MRKFVLSLALLAIMPILAQAAPSWNISGPWRLQLDTSLDLATVAAFDFKNDQWMTGISKDIFHIYKDEKKIAYLSGEQMFNLGEKGKGAFMLAVGIMTGPLAQYATEGLRHIIPDAELPKWVDTAGQMVSIEGGYGRRLFGVPQGQTPHVWTLGGKVVIPLGKLREMFMKKKASDEVEEAQ